MKLKIRNFIVLLLHTLSFALLFFPFMYYLDHGWVTGIYGDEFYLKQPFSFSYLLNRYEFAEWTEPVAIAIFIMFLVVFIALILQLVGKSNHQQNSIIALIVTIINSLGFFWYSYFLTAITEYRSSSVKLGELFYVELLIQIVLVLFFIFSYVLTNRRNLDKHNAADN